MTADNHTRSRTEQTWDAYPCEDVTKAIVDALRQAIRIETYVNGIDTYKR